MPSPPPPVYGKDGMAHTNEIDESDLERIIYYDDTELAEELPPIIPKYML